MTNAHVVGYSVVGIVVYKGKTQTGDQEGNQGPQGWFKAQWNSVYLPNTFHLSISGEQVSKKVFV